MTKEEAIKILDEVIPPPNHPTVDYEHFRITVAWETIKKTLDVEPVVRCAECKFFNREDSTTDEKCRCDVNKLWQPAHFRPYKRFGDFCSYGEKMDGKEGGKK